MSQFNLFQKMTEVKKTVTELGLNKDKKGFNYSYVTGDQILAKMVSKMNELNLLLIPSSEVGEYKQYDYKNSKGQPKTDFQVSGEMTYTWINADKPEEQFISKWAYYGQQDDISKAYGSGLTYSERYYLLKFFGIPTDYDDPDLKSYNKQNNYSNQSHNNSQATKSNGNNNNNQSVNKQTIYNEIITMLNVKKQSNANIDWNANLMNILQSKYKKSNIGDLQLEQMVELRNTVARW